MLSVSVCPHVLYFRTPAHCIEYAHLIKWSHERQEEEFDADNEEHMTWVYNHALERAKQYGIEVRLEAGFGIGVMACLASPSEANWLSPPPLCTAHMVNRQRRAHDMGIQPRTQTGKAVRHRSAAFCSSVCDRGDCMLGIPSALQGQPAVPPFPSAHCTFVCKNEEHMTWVYTRI